MTVVVRNIQGGDMGFNEHTAPILLTTSKYSQVLAFISYPFLYLRSLQVTSLALTAFAIWLRGGFAALYRYTLVIAYVVPQTSPPRLELHFRSCFSCAGLSCTTRVRASAASPPYTLGAGRERGPHL